MAIISLTLKLSPIAPSTGIILLTFWIEQFKSVNCPFSTAITGPNESPLKLIFFKVTFAFLIINAESAPVTKILWLLPLIVIFSTIGIPFW